MKYYDISIPISSETPIYEGDPGVEITPVSRISAGQGANVSLLKMGDHTATHIDPPYHFMEDGLTVDELPLDYLIGECVVRDFGDVAAIGATELESANIPAGTKRILFKTRNSTMWNNPEFQKDFTYLDPSGADWIIEQGILLAGIDYLSIDHFKSGTHPSHIKLLTAGVIIVEGLCLLDVPEGNYNLVCLPLKIKRGDGGPARAILMVD